MSQNQEQIEARLAAYIDGELDAAERAEIEKHLAANPVHRQLIAELMAQRDLLRSIPHEKAPPEIAETIQGQLERSVLLGSAAEAGEVEGLRRSRWPHRSAIAAIILLTAGLGLLVYKVLPSNKPPAEFAVATKETGPVPATLATEEPPGGNPRDAVADKSLETRKDGESLTLSPTTQPAATPAPTVVAAARPGDIIDEKPLAETTATPSPTTMPAHANEAIALNAPPPNAGPAATGGGEVAAGDLAKSAAPSPAPLSSPAAPSSTQPALADGLAMVPPAASNSQQVVNAPLINEMEKTPQEANKSQDQIAGKLASPALAAESNGSICLIVSSDDATAASQQVQTYLADNGISWQPENPERRLAFNGGFGGGYGGGGNGGRAFGSGGLINNGAPSTQPSAGDDRSFYAMNRYRSQQAAVHEPTAESEPRYFSKSGYAKDGALKEATKDASNATSTTTAPSDMTAQVEAAKQQSPAAASQIASAPALENALAAPTTSPATTEAAPIAFYCSGVTPQQAQELQSVLSARPGQSAQIVAQPTVAPTQMSFGGTTDNANAAASNVTQQAHAAQSTVAPTTIAPTTVPAIAPTTEPSAPIAQLDQSQLGKSQVAQSQVPQGQLQIQQQALQSQAAQSQNVPPQPDNSVVDKPATAVNSFNIQPQGPAQQTPAPQTIQEPQRVNLLILVRQQSPAEAPAASPTTQPAGSPDTPLPQVPKLP